MIFDITPPIVSMPSDSGVTSSNRVSRLPPAMISAWTAAPSATTSSGFSSVWGTRPKSSCTRSRTSGIRVEPPTITTSSISMGLKPASCKACRHGLRVRSMMGAINLLNSARVTSRRYFSSSTTISADSDAVRSSFAFVAAFRIAGIADFPSTSLRTRRISSSSISSPPRWVSPLVDRTSKMPSLSFRIEMSNVPPPKS